MKKTRISSREKRKPTNPKKSLLEKKIFDTLNKEQRRHQEMKFFLGETQQKKKKERLYIALC